MSAASAASAVVPQQRFGAVGLDELVAEAGLMTRIDRKYLVPTGDAARVLGALSPRTRVLEVDGLRDFAYESVYFDTADRLSYRLTAQSRRRRFKLRTRRYLDTGTAFLELKTKSGRGATVKDRAACDPAAAPVPAGRGGLAGDAHRTVAALFAERDLDPGLVPAMRPTLVSGYRRSTLLTETGSRVTVDTRLRWATPDGCVLELPGYVILESKSPGGACELDRLLWRQGHRPSRISKFGTGTAALHPELPRNKWARLLRGPFALAIAQNPGSQPARPAGLTSVIEPAEMTGA